MRKGKGENGCFHKYSIVVESRRSDYTYTYLPTDSNYYIITIYLGTYLLFLP